MKTLSDAVFELRPSRACIYNLPPYLLNPIYQRIYTTLLIIFLLIQKFHQTHKKHKI